MLWILSDGTEIAVTDNSEGFNVYVPLADRTDMWPFVENVVDAKDLSSYTLVGERETHEYTGMVFMGLTVLEGAGDFMHLHFSTGIAEENARLARENRELRDLAEANADKAAGYDILTGGL